MAKVEQTVNVNSVSRISAGTFFKGEVSSPYDLRIDGGFDGKLYTKGRVVVGESANVGGEMICENVDLWGSVKGDLYVKDTLSLKSGCTMEGSINVRKLIVELGAAFNGTCKMITEEEFDKVVASEELAKVLDPVQKQGEQQPKAKK